MHCLLELLRISKLPPSRSPDESTVVNFCTTPERLSRRPDFTRLDISRVLRLHRDASSRARKIAEPFFASVAYLPSKNYTLVQVVRHCKWPPFVKGLLLQVFPEKSVHEELSRHPFRGHHPVPPASVAQQYP